MTKERLISRKTGKDRSFNLFQPYKVLKCMKNNVKHGSIRKFDIKAGASVHQIDLKGQLDKEKRLNDNC